MVVGPPVKEDGVAGLAPELQPCVLEMVMCLAFLCSLCSLAPLMDAVDRNGDHTTAQSITSF